MKLLTVSDKESSLLYSPQIKKRYNDVDLVLSCGDLSYFYLEYIISALDIPLYYVRGNHAKKIEYGCAGERTEPWGAVNLHKKVIRDSKTGLLLAGIQGSLQYNRGDYQYSQFQMWMMVMKLVPSLVINKIRYGRYLDIFITHAPPLGIHDQDDPAHQGVKAFNWLINTFQPSYHIHGHVHIYRRDVTRETMLKNTLIMNTYGHCKLVIQPQTKLQTVNK